MIGYTTEKAVWKTCNEMTWECFVSFQLRIVLIISGSIRYGQSYINF